MKLVYDKGLEDSSDSVTRFVNGLFVHRENHLPRYRATVDSAVHGYFAARMWGSETPMFVEALRDDLTKHVAGFTEGKSHYSDNDRAKAYFGTIRECIRLGRSLHRENLENAENAYARLSVN